ncbi:pentatricopeptide repeat-containing protein At1g20230 [Gastrolobium bilobum]|uniref:pentatricopeptide repeat-containing protein At1g20230 n=1 Tax=Gastrolobium bilobum TaxID=150636 RepID=UPI002AB0EDFE|nr:pentatricopeptide repeat-containing protein At1g20230 [Gastrolobium bilobum]XP_061356037.1 pentatricopeptide repeat-containing protein At1g20230 [Gastrolobium bilobum]
MFHAIYHSISQCLNSTTASLLQARQAHAHILKFGLFGDTHLTTRLLSLYANNLCFPEVNLVLSSLPQPNLFSFSTVIHAFARSYQFHHVLGAFSQMGSRGLVPDGFLLPSAIKACAGLKALKPGRQVHGFVSVSGFASDSIVMSSLVHMYLKCDRIEDAHKLFDSMPERDVVVWSAMISGYSRLGLVDKAKELFSEMRNEGVEPNLVSWNGMIAGFSYNGSHVEAVMMFQMMFSEGFWPDGSTVSCVLPAIGNLEDVVMGAQVHGYVIKQGLGLDRFVVSALLDMYGKCGCASEMSRVFDEVDQTEIGSLNAFLTGLSRNGQVDTAVEVFKKFKAQEIELNVVTWTSIIASCSQNGKDMEAMELFRDMQADGVEPNAVTIPSLIPACGNISALTHGKEIHCFSLRKGIFDDVYVGSALIDMYAKCGRIHLARHCFDKMLAPNLVSWNAVMKGYAMHGKAKETIEMFHMMQQSGQKPDSITFTCVLSACTQNGLTEEGSHYFNSMSKEHGIEATMEHYACMVTLLSRVGKLEKAYSIIKEMPFEPDACIWGALLSSCRVHHNLSLGEIAAEKLFLLEPDNPGNYILLSNIYASKGMWDEVNRIRDVMKGKGLRKNPGCSWIEIGHKVHMLLAGDKSHPQMKEVLEKLDKLSIEMKKSGHFPKTNFVLQDVEEQDKEQILCGHSEKLAVVLGLLNTSPGQPLQVIKNLRICDDCHAVINFISRLEGREIYVRDTNRFHHFKDGVCSCGDFW